MTYGIEHKLNDKFNIKYYGGYTSMKRTGTDDSTQINDSINDKTFYQGIYNGKVISNELQSTYTTKGINATIGISHYLESMNVNTFYRYYNEWAFPSPVYDTIKSSLDTIASESSIFSEYLQLEINGSIINDKLDYLNLVIGARMNHNSLFGNQLTYSINPSIKTDENSLLYLSWSTGFNAPSLYQLYSPENNYQSLITRGNKSLQPETSSSLEIGWKKTFSKNLTVGFSVFSNKVENAIEYVYLWNKNIGIDTLGNDWMRDDYFGDTYINIGTLKSKGVELSIHGKVSEKFAINANISLVMGSISYHPDQIDLSHTDSNHVQLYSNGEFINKEKSSSILVRRPSTANITLLYSPIKPLTFGLTTRFTDNRYDVFYDSGSGPYGALGQRPVEAYSLVDLSVNYTIKEKFLINVRGENIFDVKYQQTEGFNTRGRCVFFGISYKL
jgi:vitamin B12 transporter